ncbi:hypothetical protein [Megasphaera vaginalis (ex Bordigoni et al. 2020)]|nr:hypothetical protein [Megasphaera vaginalis (ex Bordigoni et al. 2020)]
MATASCSRRHRLVVAGNLFDAHCRRHMMEEAIAENGVLDTGRN